MDLGFKLTKEIDQHVGGDLLTLEQVGILINCFADKKDPSDVNLEYFISKEIVEMFYFQMDRIKQCIIAVVIGNYHTGLIVDENDPNWLWGKPISTIEELKYWVFFIGKRDYNEAGSWLYNFSQGNFDILKPFFDNIIDITIQATTGGDVEEYLNQIKIDYPFIQN